jgi:glycosyltransferase involved in cell wall biosynthesis
MKRLSVLITSSYYWPEGAGTAPYLTGLAEYLSSRRHEVIVATTFAHYPDWRSSANGRFMCSEVRAGVTVRRRAHFVPRHQSAAQRALYEATLLASGLTALGLRRRPDVVIGTCPSLAAGMLARIAANAYRVPYGLIFQDLMGLAARQSGVTGGDRVASTVRRAELAIATRAEGVAIIAEGFRAYFEAGGVKPERIIRLRNWTRRVDPQETREETRMRLGWPPDELVCLHGGNMGQKQGLGNLLDAAALLDGERIRIVLAGDGNDRAQLQADARRRRLANVQFMPMQGPGRWEELMQASDILLVNQRVSVADMSLPSKLTSYFAAGRPVVAAVSPDSETAHEIGAAKAGYVVPPEEPAALRDVLRSLMGDPSAASAVGATVRGYAEKHLSAEVSLERHERFVLDVASRRVKRPEFERSGNGGQPQPPDLRARRRSHGGSSVRRGEDPG